MTDAHAILAAAWEAGPDTLPLLVLADLFDEIAECEAAETLRVTVAETSTSRHDKERTDRLKQLRAEAWRKFRLTGWPNMALQGDTGAASFSRRSSPALPDWEYVVVRPDRHTLHRFCVGLDGGHVVVCTLDGLELLRRPLPPDRLASVRERSELHWRGAFTLLHDFFPMPEGWHADPAVAEAEQLQRWEVVIGPAAIRIAELPSELVPYVAWVLCEYVTDRGRRVREGSVVPGAHIFMFRTIDGRWRHAQALENRDAGRAVSLLRQRFRRELNGDRSSAAGLLIRAADDGRVMARKLVWAGSDGAEHESTNLAGANASLPSDVFRRAAEDVGVGSEMAERFVLGDEAKLRELFGTANQTG